MKINAILAVDSKNGIGLNNTIPWKFKEDMAFFREKTLHQHVVMGRNTFASFGKKCLKHRRTHTIIQSDVDWWLTLDEVYENHGNHINFMPSVDRLLQVYRHQDKTMRTAYGYHYEMWIIGGARLYNDVFKRHLVDEIFLTRIHSDFNCDVSVTLPPQDRFDIEAVKEIQSDTGLTGTIERWVKKK